MRRTAVITGATSGIGAAFARRLASEGYDLIITGRVQDDIPGLMDYLDKLEDIRTNLIIAEFTKDEDVQNVLDAVANDENIEILINNAGYRGDMKPFIESSVEDHERMIRVHQIVPMKLIYAVLPQMSKRKNGIIINVSSMATFSPLPGLSVYGGTKSFMRFFSEVLYQELRKKGISVQALCPGYTDTNFVKEYLTEEERKALSDNAKFMMMSADEVVEDSLKHLKNNRATYIPGLKNKVVTAFLSALPRFLYYRITSKTSDA